MSIKSDEQPACPSASRNNESVAEVCDLMQNKRRMSNHEMDEEAGISFGSCLSL
jgi:hypothetical protein